MGSKWWKWRMKKCKDERKTGVTSKGGEEKGKRMEEEGLDFSSVNVKVKVKLQLIYNTSLLTSELYKNYWCREGG